MRLTEIAADLTRRAAERMKDKPLPRRRVFQVTDESLQRGFLEIVDAEVSNLRSFVETFQRALASKEPDAQFPPSISTDAKMRELTGWAVTDRTIPIGPGLWVLEMGPEIILSGGKVFVTVPDADYLVAKESEGWQTARLVEEIRKWTPPAGLRELEKTRFGMDPVGVGRVTPSSEELRRHNIAPVPSVYS